MSVDVATPTTGGWWKLPLASLLMLGATLVSDLALLTHKIRKYLLDRAEWLVFKAEKLRGEIA